MLYDLLKSGFGNEENYNCAERMLYGANQVYNLGLTSEALKLSSGFGGGMGVGATCGALTGAIMAISSRFVETICRDSDVMDIIKEFLGDYEKEMGYIDCKNLKENYKTEEDGCNKVIFEAAKIFDQIYSKYKNS